MKMELTREKIIEMCKTEPEAVADLVLSLLQRVDELTQRVHELDRRLNLNSRNSSKPPSSDGYKKPNPKSLCGKSGKPSGGQPGHQGPHLSFTDHPDHIVTHSPSFCQICGQTLEGVDAPSYDRRQVYELVVRFETTEHRAEVRYCPHCDHRNQASFPEEVPYPVQYGSALKAFLIYGNVYQFLPFERLTEMLFDLTGHSVSEGTLSMRIKRCTSNWKPLRWRSRNSCPQLLCFILMSLVYASMARCIGFIVSAITHSRTTPSIQNGGRRRRRMPTFYRPTPASLFMMGWLRTERTHVSIRCATFTMSVN